MKFLIKTLINKLNLSVKAAAADAVAAAPTPPPAIASWHFFDNAGFSFELKYVRKNRCTNSSHVTIFEATNEFCA